jgi:two-component system, NarL family, sensor kinase
MLVALARRPQQHAPPEHEANGDGTRAAGDALSAPHRALTSGRRVALVQFAVCSVAVLLVVGTIGAVALRKAATRESLEDARALTASIARGVIGPEITASVLRGNADAIDRLDAIVRARVLHDPVVRIKVWTRDGRIAYSDANELIGQRFALPPDVERGFMNPRGHAKLSELSRPENGFERGQTRLVEVYMGVTTPSGEKVAVETYRLAGSIDDGTRRIWRAFLPVLLLVVLALAAAQVPLAFFLARRVRQQAQERERLVRRADDRVEAERLRIAAELHDGVVQDLVGVAYELRAVADDLPDDPYAQPGGGLGDILRRSEQSCRNSVRALRALLLELRPSERRAEALEATIDRLAGPMRERGVDVKVDVALERPLPADVAELVYRAAQEGLRNVDRHAGARSAGVRVADDGREVTLRVHDDGCGMTAADLEEQRAAGHMGLRLLADGIAARGGSLGIESEPGTGTRLTLCLPWA